MKKKFSDNWESVSDEFINAGMSVMFTGHYHANVTKRTTGGKELFDVETGSLVTAPIPYRIITLKGNELNIHTKYVTDISAKLYSEMLSWRILQEMKKFHPRDRQPMKCWVNYHPLSVVRFHLFGRILNLRTIISVKIRNSIITRR